MFNVCLCIMFILCFYLFYLRLFYANVNLVYNSWMQQNNYLNCLYPYSTLKLTLKCNGDMEYFYLLTIKVLKYNVR